MKTTSRLGSLVISIGFTAACGQTERPPLDSWLGAQELANAERANTLALNTLALNTLALNTLALNTLALNTLALNTAQENIARAEAMIANNVTFSGVSFTGFTVADVAINNVTVSHGKLTGTSAVDGSALGGTDFKNAYMTGVLSDSSSASVRIDDITHDDTFNVDWYQVSISIDAGASWGPLCANGVGALPLNNRWSDNGAPIADSNLFTFACDGAALAKCFKWGYDPQNSKSECDKDGNCQTQSLQPWHQACTNLVRANYCGDGVPHTRTGTPIDIYDNLGIETRAGTLRGTEADWSVDGGHCIRQTRWVNATGLGSDYDYVVAVCPGRLAINDPTCGDDPNQSVDITNYPTANGFSVSPAVRHLLRNDSDGYLQ